MSDVETVIVGGGPAGAATACGLAGGGREVDADRTRRSARITKSAANSSASRRRRNCSASASTQPRSARSRSTAWRSIRPARAMSRAAVPGAVAVALSARCGAAAARRASRRGGQARRVGAPRHAGRRRLDVALRRRRDGALPSAGPRHRQMGPARHRGCARCLARRFEDAFAAGSATCAPRSPAASSCLCWIAAMPVLS